MVTSEKSMHMMIQHRRKFCGKIRCLALLKNIVPVAVLLDISH